MSRFKRNSNTLHGLSAIAVQSVCGLSKHLGSECRTPRERDEQSVAGLKTILKNPPN